MTNKEKFLQKKPIKTHSLVIVWFLIALLLCVVLLTLSPFGLFGLRAFVVSNTDSMRPALKESDFLILNTNSFERVKEGDIISFKSPFIVNGTKRHLVITHKVEAVYKDDEGNKRLRTKGINAPQPDARLVSINGTDGTNEFVGRVVYRSRALGLIFGFIRSPLGVLMIVLNIGFVITAIIIIKEPREK